MTDELIIDRSIDYWYIASSMVHGFIDGLIYSVNERRVQRRRRWAAAGAPGLQRGRFLQRLADYERRDTNAQKRRSGVIEPIRPTPVGNFRSRVDSRGTLRAFFRVANRRPAVQEAAAL